MASTTSASPITSLNPNDVTFPEIEIWENAYPDRNFTVNISIPEFTSVCPKTGLPDFGTITIEYIPHLQCLELKALKYYLLAYRNMGIFYERVVNQVLDDCVKACQPRYMKVVGNFTARGGISTTVESEYLNPEFLELVDDEGQ